MLASLVSTNSASAVHVHLLHDQRLAPSEVTGLVSIAESAGASCTPRPINSSATDLLPSSARFPLNVWYRVLLPDLLPDLPRILYLDADTLVTDTLTPLWDLDMADAWVGAVTNPLFGHMVPRIRAELGLPDPRGYFNSGVLLMDLDAWRANDVSRHVIEVAIRKPHLEWPDQDALNTVLHDHRHQLHPRWNAMPGLFELPPRFLPYECREIREAVEDPAIVHFVGPYKPWHYRSRHPYQAEYFSSLRTTQWSDRAVEGRSAWHAVLRRLPPLWAYRTEFAVANWDRRARAASQRVKRKVRRHL
jgi:lipopolysaccharide biosynthesis glycosyltransferase